MLLAGDVGGTKTLLGLFEAMSPRPRPILVRAFTTMHYPDLAAMISALAAERASAALDVEAACFGVAGPVAGRTAELTNIPWRVDADQVAQRFGVAQVSLLNDLQAMAHAVPLLEGSELHVLQAGEGLTGGNVAVIAAGTGLGEALLHHVDGRLVPSPTEGGHADFAARTEREITLLRDLTQRFGRAEVEHVLSGRGLVNIHRVTHPGGCFVVEDPDGPDAPARISASALQRRCGGCIEALDVFVEAYGAEAGNHALRSVATGGVFVGGGIAPRILPALDTGRFMRAFRDKPPLVALLSRIPVSVILNEEAGLLGAALAAQATLYT